MTPLVTILFEYHKVVKCFKYFATSDERLGITKNIKKQCWYYMNASTM